MKRLFTLLMTCFVVVGVMGQTTFTSIADGDVNNPAIWSTDGGATACNCIPTTELPTVSAWNLGNVEVYHHIRSPKPSIIIGSLQIVTVHAGANLSGTVKMEIRNGVLNNSGNVQFTEIEVFNSGYLNSEGVLMIDPGNLINAFQGRIDLAGYVNIPNGNLQNEGWLHIKRNAQVIIGGEVTNLSIVNLEPGSCVNISGDFTNEVEVNLVNGPGNAYVESGNNIQNLGFWDTDVDWCAGGTASGLSHDSNCSNCGTLPVELMDFEAILSDGTVTLNWQTQSETGNSHFSILRSPDGLTFAPLLQIPSQSPESGNVYVATDPFPYSGTSWYRLTQTDQDGKTQTLETVLMLNENFVGTTFSAFPNPFKDELQISTYGLEGAPVVVTLSDLQGKIVFVGKIQETADFETHSFRPEGLKTGLYLLKMEGNRMRKQLRIFHF